MKNSVNLADHNILKDAVIDLTLENSKLKTQLQETKQRLEDYSNWWTSTCRERDELKKELQHLRSQEVPTEAAEV